METKRIKLSGLMLAVCLAVTLAAPSLAQAGRGHHRHHHHHDHGHHRHHQHFIGGGDNYGYSQPRGYYPPAQYNYNYYPAPVYVVPPQMMMGINTGNMDFMIRF